jgi:hypothetical protein
LERASEHDGWKNKGAGKTKVPATKYRQIGQFEGERGLCQEAWKRRTAHMK